MRATLLLIFLFEHPACTFEASTCWLYLLFMNNMITYSVSFEADLQVRPCGTGPLRTHIVPAFSRAAQFVRPVRKDDRPAPCARRSAKSRSAGPLYSCNYKRLILHVLYFYILTNAWGVCRQYYVTLRESILSCLLSMPAIPTAGPDSRLAPATERRPRAASVVDTAKFI